MSRFWVTTPINAEVGVAQADLDKWICAFYRPELYSSWLRRRYEWLRRRDLGKIHEVKLLRLLLDFRAEVDARVRLERDLLFQSQELNPK